ncbi:MAG: MATE family efflux transporter [Gemmatimonadota bacterium]
MTTDSRIDPTRGSVRTAVRRLAIPAVAATLLQGLFNIVDMFWVGRGLGAAALAGVGTASFVVWAILSLAEMPSVGVTAVASRRWGERNDRQAQEAGYQAFGLAAVVAIVVGLGGLLSLESLFLVMDTPPEVTVRGADYLVVYLVGCPIVFSYFAMDTNFRAARDTRTPLQILLIALAANALLDPLLILGLGPFPRLGTAGAALATILTRTGSTVLGYQLLRRRGLIRRVRLSAATMRAIAWIGLPVAAGGVTFSVIYILLTRLTSQFGTAGLAAIGVGHKIESLSFLACIGFGTAAATAVGQNLGANQVERATRAGHAALRDALVMMSLIGTAFLVIPEQLMHLFTADPAIAAHGASYLRIVALAQLFMAFELVLQIAMEGAGYTVLPTLSGVVLTSLRLPLAWWLRVPLGLAGIWWAISVTAIARGAVMIGIWRRGTWRTQKV